MFHEYRQCWIELLCSPHDYYKWDVYVYFPDGDNECAGTNLGNIPAARFAAIQLIEKERLLHHSDNPEYCF